MDSPTINCSPEETVFKYIEIMKNSLKYKTQKKFYNRSKIPKESSLNKSFNYGNINTKEESSIYSKKKSEPVISKSMISKSQEKDKVKGNKYKVFPSFHEERQCIERNSNNQLNVNEYNKSLILFREILTEDEKKECVDNLKEILKIIEKVSIFVQKENSSLEEKLRMI